MKNIDDNERYNEVKRRQDLNVEESGANDKYHENTIIKYPYKYIDNYLIKLIEKKNGNLKLLDYCCGTGIRTVTAIKNGYECYGVDISEKSIELAKKQLESLNPNFSKNYFVDNAEKLSFQDNFFDVVISYGSFSYLNFDVAINEVKRVLKSNGIFIILDTTNNNFFINVKRYIKYKKNIVSQYHLENLFDNKKIDKLEKNYFNKSETQYFHLFSTLMIFLPETHPYIYAKKFSLCIDNFFQKTFLKYFYWKFVCILKNPIIND